MAIVEEILDGPPNREKLMDDLRHNLVEAHQLITGRKGCYWTYKVAAEQLICNHGIVFCLYSSMREVHLRDN